MKLMRISIALCGAALLYSASAFANDSNKTTSTITITEKVSIEGKTLAPGEYKVQWERNGSTAQVTVLHGKDTVATFPAHVTEQPGQNPSDAYGTTKRPDGSLALTTIFPGGRRYVLQGEPGALSTQQAATPESN